MNALKEEGSLESGSSPWILKAQKMIGQIPEQDKHKVQVHKNYLYITNSILNTNTKPPGLAEMVLRIEAPGCGCGTRARQAQVRWHLGVVVFKRFLFFNLVWTVSKNIPIFDFVSI